MAFYSTGKTKFSQAEQINDNNPVKILGLNSSNVVVTSDPNNVKDWVAGTYSENTVVTKEINGQLYSFKSTADNNATEPLLNSTKPAWENPLGGAYVGIWDNTTSYVFGNIVNQDGYAYFCITTNTNSDPRLLIYNIWIKLGKLIGNYVSGNIYKNEDVVITTGQQVLISNYDNNNYPLNYGIVSKWEVINGYTNTVICWGDSLTLGQGSTGNSNYPDYLSLFLGVNVDNEGISGETSTQIKNRFNLAPEKYKYPTIFWVGRNNLADPTTIKADIAEMVSKLNHDRYLVIGIIKHVYEDNTQAEVLNAELKAIYQDRFVDMQPYLLTKYDSAIPQDVIDHNNGYISWSLRQDFLHLNNNGYQYAAKLIASRFLYLQATPKIMMTIDPYVALSGLTAQTLMKNQNGEIVYAPSIGSGYVPFENSLGVMNTSKIFYNGTETGVNTGNDLEAGFTFQTNGTFGLGTKGSARIYGGTLSATRAYIQIRDINLAQEFQIFNKNLIISDSVDVSTGEKLQVNGTAKFTGEVTVPNATVSTSAVNLGQLQNSISRQINITSALTYPIVPTSNTIMVTFNGTISTTTLPTITGNSGAIIFLTNAGTGAVTINSNAGANDIWEGGVLSNLSTVPTGSVMRLINDGIKWRVL